MTVQGLARLNRKFDRLPQAAETAARAALEKSADEIVAMMRRLVPKPTGTLERSIGWTWGAAPEGSKVFGTVKGGEEVTITIYAGNDEAFYARWVEFGTVNATARPYFYPSYRANRKRAVGRVKRALNKAARNA